MGFEVDIANDGVKQLIWQKIIKYIMYLWIFRLPKDGLRLHIRKNTKGFDNGTPIIALSAAVMEKIRAY